MVYSTYAEKLVTMTTMLFIVMMVFIDRWRCTRWKLYCIAGGAISQQAVGLNK